MIRLSAQVFIYECSDSMLQDISSLLEIALSAIRDFNRNSKKPFLSLSKYVSTSCGDIISSYSVACSNFQTPLLRLEKIYLNGPSSGAQNDHNGKAFCRPANRQFQARESLGISYTPLTYPQILLDPL